MKTRAAVVEERGGELQVDTVEVRDPGPGEVRVRVRACGICRSDLHAIDGGEDVRYPAVLGHEAAGFVESAGPEVTDLEIGDAVVLSWTPACGECPACRRREVHLCQGVSMSGGDETPLSRHGRPLDCFMRLGAFCEHVVVPAAMAVPVGSAIPPHLSCLLGCAGMTGFGAATKTAGVRRGESVVVLGCGGVGLAAVQGARLAGAAPIFAVDPIAERRQAALAGGASLVLEPNAARREVQRLTDEGADVALECVGRPETMVEALRLTRPGGRAVVVGLPPLSAVLEIPALLVLPGRSLVGSIYGSADPAQDFPALVEHWRSGRLDLEALVGRHVPLERIQEGIEATRTSQTVRVVVEL